MSPHGDRSILIVARDGTRTAALEWAISRLDPEITVWMNETDEPIKGRASYVAGQEGQLIDQLRTLHEERGKTPQQYNQVTLVLSTPQLSNMYLDDLEKLVGTGHSTYTQVIIAVPPSEEYMIPRRTRVRMHRVAIPDDDDPDRARFTLDAQQIPETEYLCKAEAPRVACYRKQGHTRDHWDSELGIFWSHANG